MSKLNKEECLEALNYLASGQCSYCWKSGNEEVLVYDDANKMLTQLINEHFDNLPLKFEELKEGMWVWDSYRKRWFTVDAIFTSPATKIQYFMDFRTTIEFEENRLYRKQVQENV